MDVSNCKKEETAVKVFVLQIFVKRTNLEKLCWRGNKNRPPVSQLMYDVVLFVPQEVCSFLAVIKESEHFVCECTILCAVGVRCFMGCRMEQKEIEILPKIFNAFVSFHPTNPLLQMDETD